MIYILISITLLAVISPGPDFIVVMKNAMKSKSQGYFTTLGIASAIFIHVGYCIAGVGLIISQSIMLFQIIKILGALYLLYLSYQLLKSKKQTKNNLQSEKKLSSFQAFKEGFITNALNPKATLFFLSVFSQVISPDTLILTQLLYGTVMALTAGTWFIILTTIINFSFLQKYMLQIQYYINKLFGGILALLGLKILFQTK